MLIICIIPTYVLLYQILIQTPNISKIPDMIFLILIFPVESIFDGFKTIRTRKITFLTKNLKNHLYNHHHLICFDRPQAPTIRLKLLKIKPVPQFSTQNPFLMVSKRLGLVKWAKNYFFDEKSQKSPLQPPPLDLFCSPLGPHYTPKYQENKAPIPIFDVESIFDGFTTIGKR